MDAEDRARPGPRWSPGERPEAPIRGVRPTGEREPPRFVEGAAAFHREHGRVDVLAAVGPQRLIRVQTGRGPSAIAVLAVHVGELSPASGSPDGSELPA